MKNIIDPFTPGRDPFDELDDFYRDVPKAAVDDEKQRAARGRTIERLLTWLANNPLLRKYDDHIRGGNSLNTLPEHALGERLYAMVTCSLAARGDIEIISPTNVKHSGAESQEEFYRRTALGIAIMLWRS
jgi:hypothetical protein